MPKFIVEVSDEMEVYEFSEDTGKLELTDSDEAYENEIYDALRDYGFDDIIVKRIDKDTPETGTDPTD